MSASEVALGDDERLRLVAHYGFYRSLDSGTRVPTTEAQRRFVAVCRGTLIPETAHERAYLRFKQAVAAAGVDEAEVVAAGFIVPVPSEPAEVDLSEFIDIPVRACAGCGRPIPPERLEALPEATMCVPCQQGAELAPTNWRVSEVECPRCARNGFRSLLVWRTARDATISGYFLGCSRFPECRYVDRL